MIFKPESYLLDFEDIESQLERGSYSKNFKNGILICPNVLYCLILGNYSKSLENISKSNVESFSLTREENLGFRAVTTLLNKIKVLIGLNPPLFITPHIFTKFIHLLWDRKLQISEKHYKRILELFRDEFSYIQEEEIKREILIELDNFRNKVFGISEASLSVLKNRKEQPCIFSFSDKVLCEYNEDFLYVNFKELMEFIKEEDRRNKII